MKEYVRDKRSPTPRSAATSKIMSAIKAKHTKPEVLIRKALWQAGAKGYRLHPKDLPGRPDIIFRKKKLAIFVNGCYWHRCPHCNLSLPKHNTGFWEKKFTRNVERDKEKHLVLSRIGWKVITIWECKIKAQLGEEVNKIIKELKYLTER